MANNSPSQSESKINRFPCIFLSFFVRPEPKKSRASSDAAHAQNENSGIPPALASVTWVLGCLGSFAFFFLFQHPYHFRATSTTSDWMSSSNDISSASPPPKSPPFYTLYGFLLRKSNWIGGRRQPVREPDRRQRIEKAGSGERNRENVGSCAWKCLKVPWAVSVGEGFIGGIPASLPLIAQRVDEGITAEVKGWAARRERSN